MMARNNIASPEPNSRLAEVWQEISVKSQEVAEMLGAISINSSEEMGEPGPLSAREEEVLGYAAAGLTNSQIAESIGISVHGVKFHLANIYRKLEVSNRTEATVLYLQSRY